MAKSTDYELIEVSYCQKYFLSLSLQYVDLIVFFVALTISSSILSWLVRMVSQNHLFEKGSEECDEFWLKATFYREENDHIAGCREKINIPYYQCI
mgnify:CR=1 FL=1